MCSTGCCLKPAWLLILCAIQLLIGGAVIAFSVVEIQAIEEAAATRIVPVNDADQAVIFAIIAGALLVIASCLGVAAVLFKKRDMILVFILVEVFLALACGAAIAFGFLAWNDLPNGETGLLITSLLSQFLAMVTTCVAIGFGIGHRRAITDFSDDYSLEFTSV